ncbi:MAG: NYN domain-containing protein [Desulfatibacillaceae bacterium]
MGVHIIIDGYNMIGQSPTLSTGDLEQDRDCLIDFLAAYKRIKAHRITVVFDAARVDTFEARKLNMKGIDIRFSQPGQLADSVIKNMARQMRERAMVVSSDREVAGVAREAGAAVLGCREFEQVVADRLMGGAEDDPDEGPGSRQPRQTTRKRGPSRKPPKKSRRTRMRKDKL